MTKPSLKPCLSAPESNEIKHTHDEDQGETEHLVLKYDGFKKDNLEIEMVWDVKTLENSNNSLVPLCSCNPDVQNTDRRDERDGAVEQVLKTLRLVCHLAHSLQNNISLRCGESVDRLKDHSVPITTFKAVFSFRYAQNTPYQVQNMFEFGQIPNIVWDIYLTYLASNANSGQWFGSRHLKN